MSAERGFLVAALAACALWLACLLGSLDRTRLEDVDELTHARVAQAAALQGHWWPLTLDGRPFQEKPPLLLWLAGALARIGGRPYDAWPYRFWNALAGALALACLVWIGREAGGSSPGPGLGAAAALALGLQGDFIFHSRFFTFDTPFIASFLLALALSLRALRRPASGAWWAAGLGLGLAAAFKSWFVLALAPAYAAALVLALPRGRRLAAALALAAPPLLVLLAWLCLYTLWNGPAFLRQEWAVNLMGRALGRSNEADPAGHAAYYFNWAGRSAPALLPWAAAAPLGLAPLALGIDAGAGPPGSPGRFLAAWTWALGLSWLVGLALVRAETINYILPLEAGLCLAFGLAWAGRSRPGWGPCVAGLLAVSAAAAPGFVGPRLAFGLGAALGLVWLWLGRPGRARDAASPGRRRFLAPALGLAAASALLPSAWGLVWRPLDPNRALADLLLAHPPARPGLPLLVVGGTTQAVDFYGAAYALRRVPALPARRPAGAALVETRGGWTLFPAGGGPPVAGEAAP